MTVYKRLMRYVIPYWRMFIISTVGYAIYAGTQPVFAMIIQHIIDTLNSQDKKGITYLPLLFVGVGAFLGNYYLARISGNVIHKLRCAIFNHYTCLSVQYFDANNTGYMISRITNNIGEVTRATTDSVRSFIREGFTAAGLLGYLTYTNWKLSLVFLGIAPIVALMVKYIGGRMKRLSRKMQDTVGDITHVTAELVMGNRIVKGFGGEAYERQRFKECSLENRKAATR